MEKAQVQRAGNYAKALLLSERRQEFNFPKITLLPVLKSQFTCPDAAS